MHSPSWNVMTNPQVTTFTTNPKQSEMRFTRIIFGKSQIKIGSNQCSKLDQIFYPK